MEEERNNSVEENIIQNSDELCQMNDGILGKIKRGFRFVGKHIAAHKSLLAFVLAIVYAFLIFCCLEMGNKNPAFPETFYVFVNILTVFAFSAVTYIFIQRWWISSLIMGIPLTILSVANYYTLVFRNSPISTQDLYNAGTAMSVLDSYSFDITPSIVGIIIYFVLSVALVYLMYRLEKGKKYIFRNIIIKDVCLIASFMLFFHTVYFAEEPIKPKTTIVWSWEEAYYKYGYVACTVEMFQNSLEVVKMPENYDENTLEERVLAKQTEKKGQNKPDIIFILNETFYDMRKLVDLGDCPSAMPFIDSLPENQKGFALVAGTGGGTNKSEYEFLTSNTIQLMPGITPFNYLNFNNSNSIVSHLESLGYTSWAAHCAEGLNYSRNVVYPKLGFDQILFDVDFGEKEKYAWRPYATDEFCYARMISDYEKMGDAPRFMYMLTIQNHGNWDINGDEYDLIKVDNDFGEYTDDINEFQSCISLTDKSFRELTEYFSESDRDVIICMVGDHSPSFATSLIGEADREETFALRSTPYVIWANFEMDLETPAETSIPHLASMVLDASGCPMSPFYSYMNELRADVPVLTAFGLFKSADGAVYNYADDTPYKKDIETYFDMVYNNAGADVNRIQTLFDVAE